MNEDNLIARIIENNKYIEHNIKIIIGESTRVILTLGQLLKLVNKLPLSKILKSDLKLILNQRNDIVHWYFIDKNDTNDTNYDLNIILKNTININKELCDIIEIKNKR